MRGFGFAEHGSPEVTRWVDVPDPEPGPGEVRVRLRAGALNHLDRFVVEGIPGVPIELPHVIGSDGSGVVDRLGEGVTGWAQGARVLINPGFSDGTCDACRRGEENFCRSYRILGEHTQGTLAPSVVVPAVNLRALPERLGFEGGAAVPLVFQTAWRAIVTVGAIRPGETVAIVGAGGGVATAAVQIARLRGATTAVVTRSPDKGERARGLGADGAIVPSESVSMDKALWEWSGKRGVDLIFDSVGAQTLPRSLKALARGGRVVVIGATSGPQVSVDLRTLFWRQASIRGSTMSNRSEFDAVLEELAAGRLKPVIDTTFDWADAPKALPRLLSPELFGKVVVRGPPD